jgi:hypothetical protein
LLFFNPFFFGLPESGELFNLDGKAPVFRKRLREEQVQIPQIPEYLESPDEGLEGPGPLTFKTNVSA